MLRALCCLLLTLCVATALHAQEESRKPYVKLTLVGDTIETLDVKVEELRKTDLSTLQGLVDAYLYFFEDDSDISRQFKPMQKDLEKISRKAERALCEKLFDGAYLDELQKADEERRKEWETKETERKEEPRHDAKIASETKHNDGSVVVITEQKRRSWSKEGEFEIARRRLTCVKGSDGMWEIRKAEREETDWERDVDEGKDGDERKERPKKWTEDNTLGQIVLMSKGAKPTAWTTKLEGAEDCVQSVYVDLLRSLEELQMQSFSGIVRSLSKWVLVLFDKSNQEQALKKAEAEYAKMTDNSGKDFVKREVLTTEKKDDNNVVIVIKKNSDWGSDVAFSVKKTAAGWRIMKVELMRMETVYDNDGNATETVKREPLDTVRGLRWR